MTLPGLALLLGLACFLAGAFTGSAVGLVCGWLVVVVALHQGGAP